MYEHNSRRYGAEWEGRETFEAVQELKAIQSASLTPAGGASYRPANSDKSNAAIAPPHTLSEAYERQTGIACSLSLTSVGRGDDVSVYSREFKEAGSA